MSDYLAPLYLVVLAVALLLCAIGLGLLILYAELKRLNKFLREYYHE